MNTPPTNVLADPQTSMALVLKPPKGFEALYKGLSRTIPIPLVAADQQGEFRYTDDLAGEGGVASTLQRFVPVPLGASLLIIIPQPYYGSTGSGVNKPTYDYQLRWRLRTVIDSNRVIGDGDGQHPFALTPMRGHDQLPGANAAEQKRVIMPSYVSEVVTPAAVGTNVRALVGPSTFGVSSQGMYSPMGSAAADGDNAMGPSLFAPLLRPAIGNELLICISKSSGNWDFETSSEDAALSNLYGENVSGPAHAYFPGIGVYLISMSRSTTP